LKHSPPRSTFLLALFVAHNARFTPETVGEYHFFCHKDFDARKGMTGTRVVVP